MGDKQPFNGNCRFALQGRTTLNMRILQWEVKRGLSVAIFSLKRLVGKGEQKGREDREGTDEKEIQLQPASYDNMSVQQDKFL